MKLFLKLFLFLSLISCDQNKGTGETASVPSNPEEFNKQLEVASEKVVLLPEATEITSDWLAYITAESEINNFADYTVNEVISNATPIAEIMKNLKETLPVPLTSTAVSSRLAVLYTKAKVLEQKAQKRTVDPIEIATVAEQIPLEFNNFKIQLNELFLKTLEDFEEELDDPEADQERDPNRRPEITEQFN